MKQDLVKINVSDLEAGIFSTSPWPEGKYRTAWMIKLRNEPSKCKLPRGFGRLSGKTI